MILTTDIRLMNLQPHELFFSYTGDIEVEGNPEKITVTRGVAYDSIERFYTNEKGILSLVLKSQTEGQKMAYVPGSKKDQFEQKLVKTTVNVVITIEKPEEIEKFLAITQSV